MDSLDSVVTASHYCSIYYNDFCWCRWCNRGCWWRCCVYQCCLRWWFFYTFQYIVRIIIAIVMLVTEVLAIYFLHPCFEITLEITDGKICDFISFDLNKRSSKNIVQLWNFNKNVPFIWWFSLQVDIMTPELSSTIPSSSCSIFVLFLSRLPLHFAGLPLSKFGMHSDVSFIRYCVFFTYDKVINPVATFCLFQYFRLVYKYYFISDVHFCSYGVVWSEFYDIVCFIRCHGDIEDVNDAAAIGCYLCSCMIESFLWRWIW